MDNLWIDLTLYWQELAWLDWLDLLLTTAVFFLIVTALQRTQATFILRGLTVIALILLAVVFLLPLPTFSLLVQIILLFLLIALPVVFQRELRRLLGDVGRSIGLTGYSRQAKGELIHALTKAAGQMSTEYIGALIVLEGEIDLDAIAQTGIPIAGNASDELLRAIFYPKSPLHDGAILIRGRRVIAAGCILPLTQTEVTWHRHLGTRHRAAIGLSERTDALVIVVSEETGQISAAEFGELQHLPDRDALHERMLSFTRRTTRTNQRESLLHSMVNPQTRQLRSSFIRQARVFSARLGLAFLLALALWGFVLFQSNSLPEVQIRGVPLQIAAPSPGLAIANQLPETVDLSVRTVEAVAPLLNESAFTATVSLGSLSAGIYELTVQTTPRLDAPIRIMKVEPESFPVNLTPIVSRTITVTTILANEDALPIAHAVQDEPITEPAIAEVTGPVPLVEQVAEVRATIFLSNTQGNIEVRRPLIALDEQGNEISGVIVQPEQVYIQLSVERQPDVRELGIAVVTSGEPAPGFWVSGLNTQPATVVLRGPPNTLTNIGGAVATLPVDINGAAGNLSVNTPLDLPPDTTAETREGTGVTVVLVTIQISARQGSITVNRPVELIRPSTGPTLMVTPEEVELLLSGPLATLQEIEANAELIRVVVEVVEEIASGESIMLEPRVIAPEGVRVELVPQTVTLTRR